MSVTHKNTYPFHQNHPNYERFPLSDSFLGTIIICRVKYNLNHFSNVSIFPIFDLALV